MNTWFLGRPELAVFGVGEAPVAPKTISEGGGTIFGRPKNHVSKTKVSALCFEPESSTPRRRSFCFLCFVGRHIQQGRNSYDCIRTSSDLDVPGCQQLSCILIRHKYFPKALHMLYQHSCYVCFVFRSLNIYAGLGRIVSAA